MKKKLLQEYFIFSKKERNAVIVLVLLIVLIFILPYYVPVSDDRIDDQLIAAVDSAAALTSDAHDRNTAGRNPPSYYEEDRFASPNKHNNIRLFYFDPNSLSADGWMRLGLKKRTVETIGKYLSKGGKFRTPGDLKKIYGIPSKLAEQLIPYVRIESHDKKDPARIFSPGYADRRKHEKNIIKINEADSTGLIVLPGIGPKLAARIIKFRDRLGGFHSKEQLKEVYGLPDSTLQLMLPQLDLSAGDIKKLNINQADAATLAQHPYIGRNLAKVIVSYREQHGGFNSVDDLLKIDILTPELVSKLSPYIRFQ
jgi:competence ComEA-like helix-hairpin-helix protein